MRLLDVILQENNINCKITLIKELWHPRRSGGWIIWDWHLDNRKVSQQTICWAKVPFNLPPFLNSKVSKCFVSNLSGQKFCSHPFTLFCKDFSACPFKIAESTFITLKFMHHYAVLCYSHYWCWKLLLAWCNPKRRFRWRSNLFRDRSGALSPSTRATPKSCKGVIILQKLSFKRLVFA